MRFCYCLPLDGSFFRWCHPTTLCNSVCLSVTPFLGFHPIKSWLKRWQTWHTLFIILMSRLSLDSQTLWRPPAPRTTSKLTRPFHEPCAVWRSWTYSMHYQMNMVNMEYMLTNYEDDTENDFNQRKTWLNQRMCSEWNTSALHTAHFIAYTA